MTGGSLRTRLALRFTTLMAGMFILVGFVAVTLLQHILTAQFDGALLRLAAIEASAVTDSPDTTVHFHEGIFNAPRSEATGALVRYAEVWRTDGVPVVRSQSLASRDLPVSLEGMATARNGAIALVSQVWDGEPLRAIYYPLAEVAPAHRAQILQIAAPLQPVTSVVATLVWFLAAIGVVATAIAFVGGWILADRAVRPAREIAEHAEAITAGSLGARIQATADAREYRRLVAVLNDMLGRLDGAFTAQRRFVADASHEIRHPLAVLRAGLDLALRRDRSPDEYRRALADGISHADRVSALADGLLTLARTDAGVLNPQYETYDLADLVADAGRRMELFASARDVRLDVQTESLTVQLDPTLIGRALDNLIHNAVKATPPGGAVQITTAQGGRDALVHVVDAGPGIAPEHLPRLFERFFRADPSRSADGGSGLGLAIARGIAEAHRGAVSYAPAFRSGSRFTLRLPLL